MTGRSEERRVAKVGGGGAPGLPSKHIHYPGGGAGSLTHLPGKFVEVRNREETQINTECSVKAFPRDNHRNNTFGYYNITHLATFKEILSPSQAIRGSQVPSIFGPL